MVVIIVIPLRSVKEWIMVLVLLMYVPRHHES